MPASALFYDMKVRVDGLGTQMLPAVKADLSYTPEEYDRVRAYVLLVHAEIESFLETRVRDEVTRRVAAWETAGTPSVVLMGLLAFHEDQWVGPIDSLNAPANGDKNPTWASRDLVKRLKTCQTETFRLVKCNNGIKAKDVLSMLLRIGFLAHKIDSELISKLDGLGADRGTFAHNPVRAVTIQPDPGLTMTRVKEILPLLEVLDLAIDAL